MFWMLKTEGSWWAGSEILTLKIKLTVHFNNILSRKKRKKYPPRTDYRKYRIENLNSWGEIWKIIIPSKPIGLTRERAIFCLTYNNPWETKF